MSKKKFMTYFQSVTTVGILTEAESHEEAAQGDSESRCSGIGLELGQAGFDWPDRPAGGRLEGLDRQPVFTLVEWAHIAILDGFARGTFVQPAQGEPLGATHIRALLIDSASAVLGQECAGPLGARRRP